MKPINVPSILLAKGVGGAGGERPLLRHETEVPELGLWKKIGLLEKVKKESSVVSTQDGYLSNI